ncbi:polysaccharide lyase family 8 super-sandwich domain-containing protein [Chryseobacterium sp.]|uniref:polysaccharide lyase family 8 super-sandwich domain-containing protein n=1 Tax=Chryseobacterium sp. TaxID=1871047 RepID=UPI001B1A950F|nr:polysaccharide lyase family 8 super-sandwich domain-containing protein [Chryseobacterium sp.]MBO9692939.1 T9SS type A sorting domain-containing protein [Chryseobacterium sp.]
MLKKISFLFIGMILISENLSGQTCVPAFTPDLPLVPSSSSIDAEIDQIYNTAKTNMLSGGPPSQSELSTAINSYNNLNISVSGGTITGNPVNEYSKFEFIKFFVKHLKFNPNDTVIKEKVKNTMWWVYTNVCNGTLLPDLGGTPGGKYWSYGFYASLCLEFLDDDDKKRYLYVLEKNLENWRAFWKPQLSGVQDYINSDIITYYAELMVPTVKAFSSPDEQYRYLLALKRYITRYISEYSDGTKDGVKPDGTGYHHWNNYENYMYSYNSVIKTLKMLGSTSFQISPQAYLGFRDAIWHKLFIFNDKGIVPLCMGGRSGNWDGLTVDKSSISELAKIGGTILGLQTEDSVIAGEYNRRYGINASFNYSGIAANKTGFYQMNHANASAFRIKDCIVINKGFNNQLWGSEIYNTANRYGRYQSYGAMTVMYNGDRDANGFDNTKWNWNYNPGTTTKVLPWNQLIAGWERIDELSSKRFAGALAFDLKNGDILKNVYGQYGMFAMDFQERKNLGWNNVTAVETHDPTFTFKKSSFLFDDVIICLASDINNTDTNNNTVTTLYQNSTTPGNVVVNNSPYSLTGVTSSYSGTNDNWILDNFGTGYYITSGSGNVIVQRKLQQTPSQDQSNPSQLNAPAEAAIGYIDHGSAPSGLGYEYAVVPKTTIGEMQQLVTKFQNPDTKPYQVLNKTATSHIIKHKNPEIYAFALFSSHDINNVIPGNTNILTNDTPCLIMYKPINNTEIKLSLSNPDLGLPEHRSFAPFTVKTIRLSMKGDWQLVGNNPAISLVSTANGNTTYDFKTYQGLPIEANFKQSSYLSLEKAFINQDDNIKIYPNPVENTLYVNKNGLSTRWTISDINGKNIMSGINHNNKYEIDTSHLPAGIYVFSSDRYHQKFVKK